MIAAVNAPALVENQWPRRVRDRPLPLNRTPLLSMNIGSHGLKIGHLATSGYGLVGSSPSSEPKELPACLPNSERRRSDRARPEESAAEALGLQKQRRPAGAETRKARQPRNPPATS
jgi:hypothetical protein